MQDVEKGVASPAFAREVAEAIEKGNRPALVMRWREANIGGPLGWTWTGMLEEIKAPVTAESLNEKIQNLERRMIQWSRPKPWRLSLSHVADEHGHSYEIRVLALYGEKEE